MLQEIVLTISSSVLRAHVYRPSITVTLVRSVLMRQTRLRVVQTVTLRTACVAGLTLQVCL